jgi:large subunit ribosomal protein L23
MGIFSRNKASTASAAPVVPAPARNLAAVLLAPHFTEKAVGQGEKGVYTFMVRKDATKYDVTDAIKAYYGVTPVKVNIVNKIPRRSLSRSRGRVVAENGYKKAYVYLKAGDTITLV